MLKLDTIQKKNSTMNVKELGELAKLHAIVGMRELYLSARGGFS